MPAQTHRSGCLVGAAGVGWRRWSAGLAGRCTWIPDSIACPIVGRLT